MKNVMTVIGIKRVDFVADDNSRIQGYRIYLIYENDKIQGQGCTSEFLSDQKYTDPLAVGDRVIVRYNKYGKVDSIDLV